MSSSSSQVAPPAKRAKKSTGPEWQKTEEWKKLDGTPLKNNIITALMMMMYEEEPLEMAFVKREHKRPKGKVSYRDMKMMAEICMIGPRGNGNAGLTLDDCFNSDCLREIKPCKVKYKELREKAEKAFEERADTKALRALMEAVEVYDSRVIDITQEGIFGFLPNDSPKVMREKMESTMLRLVREAYDEQKEYIRA